MQALFYRNCTNSYTSYAFMCKKAAISVIHCCTRHKRSNRSNNPYIFRIYHTLAYIQGKEHIIVAEDPVQDIPKVSPPVSDSSERTMSAEEAKKELADAITGSNQVLYQSTTVLALFPDTMIIDRAKLTITTRSFFRTAEVMSMRIEDVLNITCSVGPFLGTVSVTSRVMNSDQITHIGKFWRDDAKRLKRIGQGYVIALQRNIDCSALGTQELADMLEQLGADNHPSS
jgi:hypothetical protein